MMEKKVIDVYGREVWVNDEKRKLYSFSNKKNRIRWNVPIVEDGKETDFWTDYEEPGRVEDVRLKLSTWNNKILLAYANAVKFNASKNDPENKKFEKMVEYVENHQNVFFTKTGDFRKKLVISESAIKKMMA